MSNITSKSRKRTRNTKLTRDKLAEFVRNTETDGLDRMLDTPLYTYRVLKALYKEGDLSIAGFLNNDDVYDLKISYLGPKGNLMFRDSILVLFSRYKMAGEFAEKGDALTAFLIDHDDVFYYYCEEALNNKEEEGIDSETYTQEFNHAYNRIGTIILNHNVNDFINSEEAILNHLAEK